MFECILVEFGGFGHTLYLDYMYFLLHGKKEHRQFDSIGCIAVHAQAKACE